MSEYCLRWNNHRPNLVTVFSELLTSEALVDVTLATDGHYIHAHKLVLSACSVYFKDLFGANPCKHPIVILKDIRIEDLKTVIDFIYRGEVNVAQDRLQDVLRTAESLRIKGLAENPRSFDDGGASHGGGGARFSSSSLGSQVTRQRSSLTDSREQSLSLEADDDGEPSTPPTSKRRKITASHDSSESLHDDGGDGEVERERGRGGGLCEVKDEPVDDGDGENKTPSRDHTNTNTNTNTDIDSAMGGSQEGVGGGVGGDDNTSSGLGISAAAAAGTSSSSDPCLTPTTHTQGRGKRGVLQRQQGIIRDAGGEAAAAAAAAAAVARGEEGGGKVEIKGEIERTTGGIGGGLGGEMIIPDTVVVTGGSLTVSSAPPGLLQVPAVVVGPGALTKQRSHPTPLLAPTPVVSKQLSHPESRGAPPQMTKQRSHPSVLTQSHQHLQVIPMQVFMKHHPTAPPSPGPSGAPSAPTTGTTQQSQPQQSSLRPIQPKPSSETTSTTQDSTTIKKEVPLIRLTPSEDSTGAAPSSGPPRPPLRAVSEERQPDRQDLLASPGHSVLVQSVSQDSALVDVSSIGVAGRMLASTSMSTHSQQQQQQPLLGRTTSTPGHCPVLRQGPALGCNFCWNSTDPQGRVLRRKTKYHCPECRTNLCIVPCFHEYHKQIERAHDTDKQINKILTKTGSM